MTLYSGDSLFKLNRSSAKDVVYANPELDKATWRSELPSFSGTSVGIDVSLTDQALFSAVLDVIRDSYSLDVKLKKKDKYRKPRFV